MALRNHERIKHAIRRRLPPALNWSLHSHYLSSDFLQFFRRRLERHVQTRWKGSFAWLPAWKYRMLCLVASGLDFSVASYRFNQKADLPVDTNPKLKNVENQQTLSIFSRLWVQIGSRAYRFPPPFSPLFSPFVLIKWNFYIICMMANSKDSRIALEKLAIFLFSYLEEATMDKQRGKVF